MLLKDHFLDCLFIRSGNVILPRLGVDGDKQDNTVLFKKAIKRPVGSALAMLTSRWSKPQLSDAPGSLDDRAGARAIEDQCL